VHRVGDIDFRMADGGERHALLARPHDKLGAKLTVAAENEDHVANPRRSPP